MFRMSAMEIVDKTGTTHREFHVFHESAHFFHDYHDKQDGGGLNLKYSELRFC